MSSTAPLGSLIDWFYRVEYQQRGSPHIHMLIWIKDAPIFGVHDDEVICFINKIITCQRPTDNSDLIRLVNSKVHRHSNTYRKKYKNECRFNYPQPLMKTTRILHPPDSDIPPHMLKHYRDTDMWTHINKELHDLKEGQDITFDDLLCNLNVTEENYLLALHSSLNSPYLLKEEAN